MKRQKHRTQRLLLMLFLVPLIFMAIKMTSPPPVFSEGGCPPNDTCPSGWKSVAVDCYSNYCDAWAPNGYCILCKKQIY
jgi:hypothetical protein